MIVCICKSVSDREIARAIDGGACSLEDVARCTGAGLGCGTCHESIRQVVHAGACASESAPTAAASRVQLRSDIAPRPDIAPLPGLVPLASVRRRGRSAATGS